MKKIIAVLLAGIPVLFITVNLFAATVVLKNGNSISGTIENEDRRSVTLRFDKGRMVIKKSYIASIERTEADDLRDGKRIEPPKMDFSHVERTLDLEMARLNADRANATPKPETPKPEVVPQPSENTPVKSEKYVPALGTQTYLSEIAASLHLPEHWKFEWKDGLYNIWLEYPSDESVKNKFRGSIARVDTPPGDRGKQVEMSMEWLANKHAGKIVFRNGTPKTIENTESGPKLGVYLIEFLVKSGKVYENIQHYLIWIGDYTYIITFTYPALNKTEFVLQPVFDESAMSLHAAK